ncbi:MULTISPECIES: hypothetical protein [Paenibacillus]|uniref:O-methyltransferase n=3 Tax=Paenibacillus TaxID=44249 RepID=A0ABT4EH00_PAEAL|nr:MULTISPECIES: hypothetical protein [Paenibacillus]EPY12750.1 hypothetical protein PAAL66ix_11126 [Paenibacillus alvei A6-6i-x]MCY9533038.1 O-methyltransferase [Paenibacillus alvei]OBY80858.1 O-methyltransferase [Paenibacillus sp. KS1]TQR42240.1 O-methyltransferase [Paenibacillus sp. SDF0028]SDF98539.1 hypothetical protein SAMN04488689_108249 [Paenibacillus sp. cl6col]
MKSVSIPLARQISLVFEKLESELIGLTGGTIVVCLRNDIIGKFGVKHDALESCAGELKPIRQGLSRQQIAQFLQTAIDALKHKKHWTHGEIVYDFTVRHGELHVSTWFESNHNMVHILDKKEENLHTYRNVS